MENNGAVRELYDGYGELYKKLCVTEKEYNDTYDFLTRKAGLATNYAIKEYMTEYFERDLEEDEYNPILAQIAYYEELGNKMDIRFVD